MITSDGVNGIAGVTAQAFQGGVWVNNAATTTENGEYVINDLADGDYTVFFYAFTTGFISHWYSSSLDNGADDQLGAEPITISDNDDMGGIDIILPVAEDITGTVSRDSGCEAGSVEGLWVMVYDASAVEANEDAYRGYGKTLATGEFTVTGLPSGNMKMLIWDYDGSGVEEWYKDAADFASATSISTGTEGLVVNFCSLGSVSSKVNLVPVYMVLGLL